MRNVFGVCLCTYRLPSGKLHKRCFVGNFNDLYFLFIDFGGYFTVYVGKSVANGVALGIGIIEIEAYGRCSETVILNAFISFDVFFCYVIRLRAGNGHRVKRTRYVGKRAGNFEAVAVNG